ncbi:MAG: hypothetical protein CFE28_06570 [Alphaproteobacteria bacterium PA2]|nr:MAG: hypothetical protein CFE28_06570 [Alphaproteobacteria bacterium PA2]
MNPESRAALWRRILREPLTHFLVIGAVLFVAMSLVQGARRPVVRLDNSELEQLVSYWQLQMQRPPTQAEVKAIINERVDEELLAREALRLGMDKNDMIIRRRLAEKMAFASEDTMSLPEPSEATLKSLYDKTRNQYVLPAQVAFRQVVFSGDRPNSEASAKAALEASRDRDPGPGDPFVLPLAYGGVGLDDLLRDYGPEFAAAMESMPVGVWAGPVQSPYGWHLIRIESRKARSVPGFDAVKDQVREAYLTEARKRSNADFLSQLRKRYRVEVAGGPG